MVCTIRNATAVAHPGTHKIMVDISAMVDSKDLTADVLKNALVKTTDFLRGLINHEVLTKKKAEIWNVVFVVAAEEFKEIPKKELVELTTSITDDLLNTPVDQLESMFSSKLV